jgi:hypothetical protein
MTQLNTEPKSALSLSRFLPIIEHTVSVYKLWYEYRDHFPKKSRYTLGDRIDLVFIQLVELLWAAGYQAKDEKLPTIIAAIKKLDGLKFLLRIAWEIKILDTKKYSALSEPLFEIGKMLGGWKKGLDTKTPTH